MVILKAFYISEKPIIFEGEKIDREVEICSYKTLPDILSVIEILKQCDGENKIIFGSESGENIWKILKKIEGLEHINGRFRESENVNKNLSINNFTRYKMNRKLQEKLLNSIASNSPFNPIPDRVLECFYLFGHIAFSGLCGFTYSQYGCSEIKYF